HLHGKDLPGQWIEHQTEGLESNRSQERTIMSFAKDYGRCGGMFADLKAALGDSALDRRAISQREFHLSVRSEAQGAPGGFRKNAVARTRINEEPLITRPALSIRPPQTGTQECDPHGASVEHAFSTVKSAAAVAPQTVRDLTRFPAHG